MKTVVVFLSFLLLVCGAVDGQTVTVVNGASFQARFPVAPGTLSSAFGTFTGVTSADASTLPLPTDLGNVRVLVDALPAPILAVRSTQINFQVPRTTGTGRRTIQISVGGTVVASGALDVLDFSPGIFVTGTAANNPLGAVLNENFSANTQTSAAKRGEVIQVFGTGPGALSAVIADGAIAPGGTAVVTTTLPVRGVIGAVQTAVEFSGMAPGYVGLWQVNVRVPDRPFISGQVSLFLTVGGVPTNVVSFWVAP